MHFVTAAKTNTQTMTSFLKHADHFKSSSQHNTIIHILVLASLNLSEPFWVREKKKKTHQTLCLHKQHEWQTLTPWIGQGGQGGGQAQSLPVCQRNQNTSSLALNSHKNMERNYWMVEWLHRTIRAAIWRKRRVVSSSASHAVGRKLQKERRSLWEKHWDDETQGNQWIRIIPRYARGNVDSTNFCPEGVNAEHIWISPPSFLDGKDWSLLHRASHMEYIYPICLAQQDSQRAAPQFPSV